MVGGAMKILRSLIEIWHCVFGAHRWAVVENTESGIDLLQCQRCDLKTWRTENDHDAS